MFNHPCSWAKLIRLFKLERLGEIFDIIDELIISIHLSNIISITFIYLFGSHIISCIYYMICYYETSNGGRFDGASMVFFLYINFQ